MTGDACTGIRIAGGGGCCSSSSSSSSSSELSADSSTAPARLAAAGCILDVAVSLTAGCGGSGGGAESDSSGLDRSSSAAIRGLPPLSSSESSSL